MAQDNDATAEEQTVTIHSHRTGLSDIQVGDRLEFGDGADLGAAEYQIIEIDDDLVHVRAVDPDKHTDEAWTAAEIETATESNDLRITRDGDVVA